MSSKMFQLLKGTIPSKMLLNRYVITLMVFAVWMIFFDKYKVSKSFYLYNTIQKLEKSKVDYAESIVQVQKEREDLRENSEKYAREKFYMHKDDEEVFIIEK